MSPAIPRIAAGFVVGAVAGFFAANAIDRGDAPPVAPPVAMEPAESQPAAPAAPSLGDDEIARARPAVDARPNDFTAQFNFAEALLRISRKPREAIPYYERAAKLAPRDARPLVGLGDASFASALDAARANEPGDELLAAAAKAYERALAIEPKAPAVRAALGLVLAMRTPPEHERAIREFRAALADDPRNELALQGLATSLAETGKIAEAEAAVARLEAVDPASPALAPTREAVERARAKRGR